MSNQPGRALRMPQKEFWRFRISSEAPVQSKPRFAFEQIGDGLAVADCTTDQITLLNASAAILWLTLGDAPRSAGDLATDLVSIWRDGAATAQAGIASLLQAWQASGWVSCDADGVWQLHDTVDAASSPEGAVFSALAIAAATSATEVLWQRCVGISETPVHIAVRASPAMSRTDDMRRLTGFLGGLPACSHGGSAVQLNVLVGDQGVSVLQDGQCHAFSDLTGASAFFNLTAIKLCYPDLADHTILHAGAVCRPSGAILLPAVSGSGKTTLTAYLAARGWHYAGDDVIGLARRPSSGAAELLPFPTALGIKTGSTNLLMPDYPKLADAEVVTYGNKHVRFIAVDAARLMPATGNWRTPRALVFPLHEAQADCTLRPLTEWEALELLSNAGTGTGMGTDLASFELLISLIKSVPRYRLRYGSLAAAATALESLL